MVKTSDISVIIMAHQDRSGHFPYLRQELGDVPFSIDDNDKKLGTWGNRKLALQIADKSKPYVLVIQDDAVVYSNFYKRITKFMTEHRSVLYQFFLGNIDQVIAKRKPNSDYIEAPLHWGVAICMASYLIEPMIAHGDKMASSVPDDVRMRRFFDSQGIKATYPYPGLVLHREGPSLVGNTHKKSLKTYKVRQWM